MSFNIPINQVDPTAPTPQNTPLTHAPIAQGLSRPTVPDIAEDNEPDEEEASGTIQQAMLGLVHGKLSGLVGKSSGYVESLPVEVKKNVEALKGVQVKQVELQNQYKRECLELEKKVCHSSQVPFHLAHVRPATVFVVILGTILSSWVTSVLASLKMKRSRGFVAGNLLYGMRKGSCTF